MDGWIDGGCMPVEHPTDLAYKRGRERVGVPQIARARVHSHFNCRKERQDRVTSAVFEKRCWLKITLETSVKKCEGRGG